MGHWIKLATPTDICFYFLPFSGGKFVANCLALSQHVLCNHLYLANEDMQFEIYDSTYYKFKLQAVLESLPKNFSTTRAWQEFMGIDIPITYEQGRGDIVALAREKRKTICHVAHWNDDLINYQKKYPEIKVCKLVNFKKFNELCQNLKSPNPNKHHVEGFDFWIDNSLPADFEIDVDEYMYNIDSFLAQTKNLYSHYELDDFQPELLIKFYTEYKKLHAL